MSRKSKYTDPKQIAHLWAHWSKDAETQTAYQRPYSGFNGRVEHAFYFERETIYSYGGHFPIASHAVNSKGKPCILVNRETSRSLSTGKHQRFVWSAIRRWNDTTKTY